jgi:hypothetical protein
MKLSAIVTLALSVLGAIAAAADSTPVDSDDSTPIDCATCHAPSADVPVMSILQTPHGRGACTDCHGASEAHGSAPIDHAPSISFGPKAPSPPTDRDATCLGCHKNKSEFCDRCHSYSGVDPYCMDCHVLPKGSY